MEQLNKRCKATLTIRGETYRCEGLEGHTSVHFSGSDWWPNKSGLPRKRHQLISNFDWGNHLFWLAVALIAGVAIFLLLTSL